MYIIKSVKFFNNQINYKMAKILTLDEALEEIKITSKKTTSKESDELVPDTSKIDEKIKKTATKRSETTSESNIMRILHDSKFTLNYYINKFPDIKIIDEQIGVLKQELINYKKNKSNDNYLKAQILLNDLIGKRNAVDKIFKRKEFSTKDGDKKLEEANLIRTDEKLVELRQKQKELRQLLRDNTSSALIKKLDKLRDLYAYGEYLSKEFDETDNADVLEFEDFMNENADDDLIEASTKSNEELEKDYNDLLYYIGTVTGLKKAEIISMPRLHLKKELDQKLLDTKYIKENITDVSMEIANRRSELTNKVSITDILFKTVDYKTEESGRMSKEILAASYVGLVNAIAVNICKQQGKMHLLNEAVSGGLFGLTKAINRWYAMQSVKDQPLTFENYLNSYVSNEVKKALYEVSGIYGTSGNNKATLDSHFKKRKEDFLKYNPNFKDIDPDILNDILMGIEPETIDDNGKIVINKKKLTTGLKVTNESDYNATIGGDDGGVDMFELSDYGQSSSFDFMEAQEQYKKLLYNIDRFLNMFETKTDTSGEVISTGKKLFDKYDRKILMMMWGFDHKRIVDANDPNKSEIKVTYDQKERLIELNSMFRANGVIDPRKGGILQISQPALSDREKRLEQRMKKAIENDPELKSALAYLFSYYRDSDNKAALVQLSNYREELNIAFEREELREIYSDNPEQLNKELTDGKRLSDIYEVSETNPLDEEIAELFNQ